MTALPKRKISRHRQGKRRAGQIRGKKLLPSLVKCSQCGQPKPPHQACPYCGFYKGKQVVVIKEKDKNSK